MTTGSKEEKRTKALAMSDAERKKAISYETQTRIIIWGIATGSKEEKRTKALAMSDAERKKAASYEMVTRCIIGRMTTGSKANKRAVAQGMSDAKRGELSGRGAKRKKEANKRAVAEGMSDAKRGELSGRGAKRKKEADKRAVAQGMSDAKRGELSGRQKRQRKKKAEMATLRTQFRQGAYAKTANGAVGVVVEDAPTKGRYANTVRLRLVADGSQPDRLSLDALIALTEAECEAALGGERLAKRFKPTEEKVEKAKTKKTQG
jgi:predicted transcriptional regulator